MLLNRLKSLNVRQQSVLVALLLFGFFGYHTLTGSLVRPVADSVNFYINFAETLNRTGVFGYSRTEDKPSSFITPLYPAFLSMMMSLNEDVHATFSCLKFGQLSECELKHGAVIYVQYFLAAIALLFVWLVALEVTDKRSIAWLSTLMAVMSVQYHYFAGLIMTENFIILFQCLLIFGLIKLIKSKNAVWFSCLGICLGLLTLIRPEYLYIAMLFFLVMPIYLFFKRQSMLKRLLLFLLSFMLLVAPWSVRNKLQFDSFSLTNGYAEKTLAQRLAYNEMNWKEYGSAFIYWLPDFGDSLARKLFPGVNVERLGWSKESLYSKEARNLLREIYTLPEEARMPYLLDNHFYPDVIKHGLVSIVLAWRGIFVNKYWGLLGFVCLLICMFKKKAPLDKPLLGYSLLPFLPLMVLYASVSVSIPRYYLMLIPFYAISMGTVLYMIFMRIYHRLN